MASNNALNQTSPNFTVNQITINNAPVVGTDGTNKTYVDMVAAGFQFKNACYAGTTAGLTAVYANGAAGVGATLTNAGIMAAFSVDGISPALNARILVKNQGATFQNGIYTLTTVGDGATNWVLTRATDYDTTTEIQPGDIVPIEFGTVNATTLWLQTATVTAIGVDPITFSQFFGGGIHQINGDVGSATASSGAVSLVGGTTGAVFTGSGSTMTMSFAGITANGGAVNLGTDNAANAITIGTGNVARTIDIGFSAASHGIRLGVAFGTASVDIESGSGGVTVNSVGGAANLGGSTGANLSSAAGPVLIDAAGVVELNSSGAAISVGNDANNFAVNVGTGGTRTVTLGSVTSTSATTVQSGSGALAVTSTNGTLTVNSGTGALGISTDASATTVSLATGGAVKTVTLGSTNSTSTTTIACGTGGCNVGTSANAHATVVGSTTASATTTIQGPSAGVFMTGVAGVSVANTNVVTINTVTGALGSQAASSGDVTAAANLTDNAIVRGDGGAKGVQTSVPTIDDTGNISVSTAVSGGSLSITVANTSNTASATAFYNAQVAGSTAADAYYKAEISGGQAWTLGLDNSDSDAFVVSASATPGTTNVMHSSTAGEVTFPLQPAFLAYLGSTDNNVTGTGTVYNLGSVTALTEVFDQNNDFNTNGTFTAPVTGRYALYAGAIITGCTIATTMDIAFITSNRTYIAVPSGRPAGTGDVAQTISSLVDMDAGDTAIVRLRSFGEAADTDDVLGSSTLFTFFSGYLAC